MHEQASLEDFDAEAALHLNCLTKGNENGKVHMAASLHLKTILLRMQHDMQHRK